MRILLWALALMLSNDPKEIAKINQVKKEAEQAFLAGDYVLASEKYLFLKDSLHAKDPAIDLNLGHAAFHLSDTSLAKESYNHLLSSDNQKLKSIALQQLGVMNKTAGKLEEALQQLKSAIKADPTNQNARYNYEVVKKLLEEQKNQQQDQNENKDQDQKQDQKNEDGQDENQDQNQENKDQQQEGDQEDQENQKDKNQESEDQEKSEEEKQQEQQQDEGEEQKKNEEQSEQEMTKEKLEEMGISEEKARQLLEAMRQSEIKYLQQQRRKPTKRPPSGKPDW